MIFSVRCSYTVYFCYISLVCEVLLPEGVSNVITELSEVGHDGITFFWDGLYLSCYALLVCFFLVYSNVAHSPASSAVPMHHLNCPQKCSQRAVLTKHELWPPHNVFGRARCKTRLRRTFSLQIVLGLMMVHRLDIPRSLHP